jgi:hypothetical protein
MINIVAIFPFHHAFFTEEKHDIFYVLFYGQKANFPWRKKYIHSTLTGCGNNMAVVVP